MTKAKWEGYMRRDADGEIRWKLTDAWGWQISGEAKRIEGGYALTGTIGDVPEKLRLPLVDDEEPRQP